MPTYTLEETEEFLTLPEDAIVVVSVKDITERQVEGRNGREGWTSLNFRFTLLELPTDLEEKYAPLIGQSLFGSVGAKFTTHVDNKLRQWAEALLNLDLTQPGFALDTDLLVGRKARAVIGNYTKTGQSALNHKVVALLPLAPAVVAQSAGGFSYGTDEPPF